MDLKQSTAATVKLGPFLDSTDGVSEEVALTPVVEVSKNGGAFGARNDATAITHDAEGWYLVTLDETDTGTLGRLTLKAQDSANHLPVWAEYMVLPANVWDSLYGSDYLQIDVTQWKGATAPAMTGDAFARLGSPTGASVSVDIAAVKTQTGAIETDTQDLQSQVGVAGAGLTALGDTRLANLDAAVSSRSSHSAADVKTAIEAGGSSVAAIKAKTDNLPASPAAVGSEMDLVDAPNATAVTAIQSGLAPSSTALSSAVWTSAKAAYLDAAVSSRTALGAGATQRTILIKDPSNNPVADADCWISTDSAGNNVIASGQSASDGYFKPWVDAGAYYLWAQKDGGNISNPTAVTFS